jgi:spore maturation protein B
VGTALLATLCAATVAITAAKLLEKLPFFRLRDSIEARQEAKLVEREAAEPAIEDNIIAVEPRGWRRILPLLLVLFFLGLFVRLVFPSWFGFPAEPNAANQNTFIRSVNTLSILAIPFLLSFFPVYAATRRIKVYEEFVEGAKEGFGVILKIIPFLVTMLVGIGMFKGAGGIDLLTRLLSPVLTPLHFPADLLPLALMRPLSGSATLALLTDIIHRLGPDNIVSLMAATIYGSTETTFYVAAVYFGAVNIKQTRHAIPAGLLGDLAGVIASVIICRAVL